MSVYEIVTHPVPGQPELTEAVLREKASPYRQFTGYGTNEADAKLDALRWRRERLANEGRGTRATTGRRTT